MSMVSKMLLLLENWGFARSIAFAKNSKNYL